MPNPKLSVNIKADDMEATLQKMKAAFAEVTVQMERYRQAKRHRRFQRKSSDTESEIWD